MFVEAMVMCLEFLGVYGCAERARRKQWRVPLTYGLCVSCFGCMCESVDGSEPSAVPYSDCDGARIHDVQATVNQSVGGGKAWPSWHGGDLTM